MELPTPNIPLLRKAVEWAEAEAAKAKTEREWDQKFWATRHPYCGTTYCIAGYVVTSALEGVELEEDEYGDFPLSIDGKPANWGDTAQQILGLTRYERLSLFEGNNTIEDVRLFAEEIAARVGERL